MTIFVWHEFRVVRISNELLASPRAAEFLEPIVSFPVTASKFAWNAIKSLIAVWRHFKPAAALPTFLVPAVLITTEVFVSFYWPNRAFFVLMQNWTSRSPSSTRSTFGIIELNTSRPSTSILRTCNAYKCTSIYLVPTLYIRLVKAGRVCIGNIINIWILVFNIAHIIFFEGITTLLCPVESPKIGKC